MNETAAAIPADDLRGDLEARDAFARERALDPSSSIILQAPAGSGKTTVLTQRFLRLLAEVDEPEEILAVTFTRKAAAEMRARVLDALSGRIARHADPDGQLAALARSAQARSQARGWNLHATPGRLRIQTIDAVNRALASQLPVAGRATIGLQLAEYPQSFYQQASRRTLIDAETDPELGGHFERLLERVDNDRARAERLLAFMLGVRAHWLPLILGETADGLPARVVTSLASIGRARLERAAATIPGSLVEEGIRIVRAGARNRGGAANVPAAPPTLADWRALAALALTEQGEWRRALTIREGFAQDDGVLKAEAFDWIASAARVRGAREILTELRALPDPALSDEDSATLRSLAHLLRLAASELELVFGEAARVDHAYVAGAARRALTEEGAPTDLSLRLGQRLRHILVDEFQDTSSEQLELLRALTAGWQTGDGRSLFVVGDPMQSIYLFRQAEVGLFVQVARDGLGELALEPLALTRNFRASRELVDWLNATFPQIFPETSDVRSGAIRYSPCVAGRADRRGRGVELHRLEGDDAAGEAAAVVSIVRRVRSERPGSSIAILVAARPHASAVAAALRAGDIPVAGVGLVPLSEVAAVRDLAALARALDHLGDRTAWLAVLRAPWCGLTLRDLTALLDRPDQSTVWEIINDPERLARLDPDAQRRIARTRAALADAVERQGEATDAQRLETAWMRLGGPATCESEDDLRHVERFFERLTAWSAEPDWTGAERLAERLGSLFASDAGSGAEPVQIMTIHRAKGLEFDVVIVPGLGRAPRSDPEPLLRWLELPGTTSSMDLLIAPVSPRGGDVEPLNAYLKALQARRLAHERGRLLYVAATRARFELHLLCELPTPANGAAAEPRAGTLLATLWPAMAKGMRAPDGRAVTPAPRAGQDARPAPRAERLRRLPADWRIPDIMRPKASRSFTVRGEALPLPGMEDALARRLAQLGLAGDPHGAWLFAREHRESASPLELSGILSEALVSVTVDRSFIDADGTRWLVDFRIGVHREGDTERFVADEIARYRPRLEQAIALASGLGPEPVRAGLYFPLLGVFRVL